MQVAKLTLHVQTVDTCPPYIGRFVRDEIFADLSNSVFRGIKFLQQVGASESTEKRLIIAHLFNKMHGDFA